MTNVYAVAMSPVLSACALHRHDCWEIILNLSGEGIETVGEEEFPFEPGSLTVCPPGVWHTKRCAPGQTWQDMYVSFDAEGFSVSRRRFRDDESGVCRQLIRLLQSACARPGGEACRRALCEALCAQVREWDQRTPMHPLVERILHRMTLDFSDPEFTVGRALEGLGYCEDSLRRLLREQLHKTPAACLRDLRIAHARRLLEQDVDESMPVREVAFLSGFYDPDYFCRVFRAQVGQTPREYRREKTLEGRSRRGESSAERPAQTIAD